MNAVGIFYDLAQIPQNFGCGVEQLALWSSQKPSVHQLVHQNQQTAGRNLSCRAQVTSGVNEDATTAQMAHFTSLQRHWMTQKLMLKHCRMASIGKHDHV